MTSTCDKCGHDPSQSRKSNRREIVECYNCSETMCFDCIKADAIDVGTIGETDAELLEHASDFFREDEDSGETLCPKCFES